MSISIKRAQLVSNLPGRTFALMIQGFLLYAQDQDFWQRCQHDKSHLIEKTAKVGSANPLIEVYIVELWPCYVRPPFFVGDWLQSSFQDEQQGKSVIVFSICSNLHKSGCKYGKGFNKCSAGLTKKNHISLERQQCEQVAVTVLQLFTSQLESLSVPQTVCNVREGCHTEWVRLVLTFQQLKLSLTPLTGYIFKKIGIKKCSFT